MILKICLAASTPANMPFSFTITALPMPLPNFRIVPDSACAPMVINFTNLSLYADSYQWFLNNSLFSSLPNPDPIVLTEAGKTFVFELLASNTLGGCGPISKK